MVLASAWIATPATAPPIIPAPPPQSTASYWTGFGTLMKAMVLSGSPCEVNCCEETPVQPALSTARPTTAALKLFMRIKRRRRPGGPCYKRPQGAHVLRERQPDP